MNDEYRLRIERKGDNNIQVCRVIDHQSWEVQWLIPLQGDSDPVVFKQFFNDTQFIVMTWEGRLYAFDREIQKPLWQLNLGGDLGTRALLSRDKSKLYVVYQLDHRNTYVGIYNPRDGTQIARYEVPQPVDTEFPTLRSDGKILLYFTKDRDSNNQWSHGYQVLDPETGECKRHDLPHPPRDQFDKKAPWIDSKRDIAALPLYEAPVLKGDNRSIVETRIVLFDLHTFRVLGGVPVREYFEVNQLSYYETESESVLSILQQGEPAAGDEEFEDKQEAYDDALHEVMDNLNTVKFCENEDALWLCWRSGIVRKVALDGSWRSPLLAAQTVPDCIELGVFQYKTFHTHLLEIHPSELILEEHGKRLSINLSDIDLESKESYIPVTVESVPQIEVKLPAKIKTAAEEVDKVVIRIKGDFKTQEGIHEALDLLLKKTRDIGSIRKDWLLKFLFKDSKGKKWQDDKFFKHAIQVEGAADKIARVIEQFTQYSRAERLYINEERTAFADAVLALGPSDSRHIDTCLRYWSIIDWEHDVANQEEIIPTMLETYAPNSEPGLRLRLGMALCVGSEYAEIAFLNQLEPGGEYADWIQAPGNQQQAVAIYRDLINRNLFEPNFGLKHFRERLQELADEEPTVNTFASTLLAADANKSSAESTLGQ